MTFSYHSTEVAPTKLPKLIVLEDGQPVVNYPIRFETTKPIDHTTGKTRDQTNDAARNMRYAATLGLPEVAMRQAPRMGRAIILGGAPSLKAHLDEVKALAADPDNELFAVNWTYAWLLENGIVPHNCVMFEIDPEPDSVLIKAHPDTTHYICSHCHQKTFDSLANFKRILWHSIPNSEPEVEVAEELFKDSAQCGGGIGTFTRTMTVALYLGFRQMELFGVDGSFPDDATSTHVDGYETTNDVKTDSFYVYARHEPSNTVRRFKSVGYLALQVAEFQEYCRVNHHAYALRVHGDGLLKFVHQNTYPDQYK